MIQAVFSDIDGTLLNSAHRITEKTLCAIAELRQRGIPFVIVSARPPMGITPIMKKNGFACAMVCYSGGLMLDADGTVLGQTGMPLSQADAILSFLEEEQFPLAWNLYSGFRWLVRDTADARVRLEASIVEVEPEQGGISDLACEDKVNKILCICDSGSILSIERTVKARFPDVSVVKSSDILLEIMPKGVHKALAVNELCRIWNLDPARCAAFGDQYNDVEMLDAVGYGVIMGNAPKDLLARYPLTTQDNDHDGIAHMLNKLLAE